MRGKFIVFEGIDGSGKSSALEAAAAAMENPFVTREETTSPYGDLVRFSIQQKAPPLTTTHLFLADRAQHIPDIERALASGQHVLCDRFLHSTLAYQSITLEGTVPNPMAYLRDLHSPFSLRPDIVFLFDVDASVAVQRVQARGEQTAYEKVEFLQRVASRYRELAKSDPTMTVIDASQQEQIVADEVVGRLRRLLQSQSEWA